MSTALRKATSDDMQRIAALDRVAWTGNRNSQYISDGEHAWRVWIDTAHVLVAEQDGRVAGCALAFPCLDGRLCLHKIFVDEAARGRGIGKQLLSKMLDIACDEGRDIWLTVDPINDRAVGLYRSLGFEVTRHDPHYYGDEPRYVMTARPTDG